MNKKIIAILGILLLLLSVTLGQRVFNGEKNASSKDDTQKKYGMIADDGSPMCNWDASLSEKVISENKSQAILINVKNPNKKTCESTVSLRAPGFDLSPNKEEQKITVESSSSGSLSWILSPRKSGTFEISVSDPLNTKIFGITVTNTFGLTASQAKLFSIIGSIFGPMFTLPWWAEKFWSRRKQNQNQNQNQNKNDQNNTNVS